VTAAENTAATGNKTGGCFSMIKGRQGKRDSVASARRADSGIAAVQPAATKLPPAAWI